MERKSVKSIVAEEHSFRSLRTTNYNINDYLPPNIESLSRTSVFASRLRDKTYTEPNERAVGLEVAEMKRRVERVEEEKESMRKEMEKLVRQAEAREKCLGEKEELLREKDEAIRQLTVRVGELENRLVQETLKPTLSHSRSNLHFIYYPKFLQKYEVSVQTDSIDLTFPVAAAKKAGKTSDRQMTEIEQKLSRLNMKKTVKQKSLKSSFQLPKLQRLERGDVIVGKQQDKQNMIRLSNTFQRVSNPERTREQSVQIMGMQLQQAQRMIRLYME